MESSTKNENKKKIGVNDVPAKINIDAEARALINSWIEKKENLKKLSEIKFSNIFSFARKIKKKKNASQSFKKKFDQISRNVKLCLVSLFSRKNDFKFSSKSTLWISHLFRGTFFSILFIMLMIIGFILGVYFIVH